jgi:hypothetical protein
MSLLVVMGSGETAPTMIKIHRQILEATGGGPAVMLDTPFGFQLNADDLVEKTVGYFATSVGATVEVARWRRADAAVAEQERALAQLNGASWVFAGPGSPTYALRQWTGTAVPAALADVVRRGGTLVVGSAAACTIGTHTIPVYEIYKVGEEPRWTRGLDLLGRLTGIEAALVPHFDNNEGGTSYDSRFCYLGEPRLVALEAALPDEIGVLGIDEHTALVIDLDARVARVAGNGDVTIRRRGRVRAFGAGEELALDLLGALLRGDPAPQATTPQATTPQATAGNATTSAETAPPRALPSLGAETRALQSAFDAALAVRDVPGCVTALLDLEAAIVAWSADTDQNDDTDRARRALRAMIVRLGELAEIGARDPRDVVRPYVDLALELRARARTVRDFATSDLVREGLVAAGIEVRDTPDGVSWSLRDHPH